MRLADAIVALRGALAAAPWGVALAGDEAARAGWAALAGWLDGAAAGPHAREEEVLAASHELADRRTALEAAARRALADGRSQPPPAGGGGGGGGGYAQVCQIAAHSGPVASLCVVAGGDGVGECVVTGSTYPDTRILAWDFEYLAGLGTPPASAKLAPRAKLFGHSRDTTLLVANRGGGGGGFAFASTSGDATLCAWHTPRGDAADGAAGDGGRVGPLPIDPRARATGAALEGGDFGDLTAKAASHVPAAFAGPRLVAASCPSAPRTVAFLDCSQVTADGRGGGRSRCVATASFDTRVNAIAAAGGRVVVGDASGRVHVLAFDSAASASASTADDSAAADASAQDDGGALASAPPVARPEKPASAVGAQSRPENAAGARGRASSSAAAAGGGRGRGAARGAKPAYAAAARGARPPPKRTK